MKHKFRAVIEAGFHHLPALRSAYAERDALRDRVLATEAKLAEATVSLADHAMMTSSSLSSADPIPLPPPLLRSRVAGTEDEEWFVKSGRLSVVDLTRALAAIGRSFDEFNNILEWGCGCGRILRHLPRSAAQKRLCGFDIDREALSWIDKYLPWIETSHTDGMPPLPYPDDTFDLIFNHSVMSHLDATYQDAWLDELKRALKPGGVATLSIHGKKAFSAFLDTLSPDARQTYAENLRTEGIVYTRQDGWSAHFPDFYHTSFHDVNYVFDHWAEFLDIRCYIPRGALDYQDLIVLQKPAI